jgi:GT2 family glycosyltransferase
MPAALVAPAEADWSGLRGRPAAAPLEVILPAYRGYAETLRAIHCVLAARSALDFRLLVIDDASPEPLLREALAALARRGLFRLLVNQANLGFPASANRGLEEAQGRDLVLLNADTEVYDGWLDRLHRAAYSRADAGTVTPLSNNATILSYPAPGREAGLAPRELDVLAAACGAPPVEIPTAVGFCMYLKGRCAQRVGGFDEERFGRGYGEENDFCMRAAARGWRHLAAADTYVWHWGGRSFGAEGAAASARAQRVLRRLHPGYHRLVAAFSARDPLAPARAALDAARRRLDGTA